MGYRCSEEGVDEQEQVRARLHATELEDATVFADGVR